jgi:hypothetical protein
VKFLEFSGNFEKSIKFKSGWLSGVGVWPVNPSKPTVAVGHTLAAWFHELA